MNSLSLQALNLNPFEPLQDYQFSLKKLCVLINSDTTFLLKIKISMLSNLKEFSLTSKYRSSLSPFSLSFEPSVMDSLHLYTLNLIDAPISLENLFNVLNVPRTNLLSTVDVDATQINHKAIFSQLKYLTLLNPLKDSYQPNFRHQGDLHFVFLDRHYWIPHIFPALASIDISSHVLPSILPLASLQKLTSLITNQITIDSTIKIVAQANKSTLFFSHLDFLSFETQIELSHTNLIPDSFNDPVFWEIFYIVFPTLFQDLISLQGGIVHFISKNLSPISPIPIKNYGSLGWLYLDKSGLFQEKWKYSSFNFAQGFRLEFNLGHNSHRFAYLLPALSLNPNIFNFPLANGLYFNSSNPSLHQFSEFLDEKYQGIRQKMLDIKLDNVSLKTIGRNAYEQLSDIYPNISSLRFSGCCFGKKLYQQNLYFKSATLKYLKFSSSTLKFFPGDFGDHLPQLTTLHFFSSLNIHILLDIHLPRLEKFVLDYVNINKIHPDFGKHLPRLKTLQITNMRSPKGIFVPNLFMKSLETLSIMKSDLESFDPNFGQGLSRLKTLRMKTNSKTVPNFNLPLLKYLSIDYSAISSLPENFGSKMPKLQEFSLYSCKKLTLLPNIHGPRIRIFDIGKTGIVEFHPEFGTKLPLIKDLSCYRKSLTNIPNFGGSSIQSIAFRNSGVSRIHSLFGSRLPSLKILNLADTRDLVHLPNIRSNTLTYLVLSRSGIREIHSDFGEHLPHLKSMCLDSTYNLKNVPNLKCGKLRKLNLSRSSITELHPKFGSHLHLLSILKCDSSTSLSKISILHCPLLERLSLTDSVCSIDPSFGLKLINLKFLCISRVKNISKDTQTLPFTFKLPNLVRLELVGLKFPMGIQSTFGDSFPKLSTLKLCDSKFSRFPQIHCPLLKILDLRRSTISSLEKNFSLPNLVKLNLSNTRRFFFLDSIKCPKLMSLSLKRSGLKSISKDFLRDDIPNVKVNIRNTEFSLRMNSQQREAFCAIWN